MKIRRITTSLAVLPLVLVSPIVWADETPTKVTAQNRSGDLPFSTSVGTNIERVDIGSGNLIVKIPIAAVPGRGMNFGFALRYDGRFLVVSDYIDPQTGSEYQYWNISGIPGPTSPDPNSGIVGWGATQSNLTYGTQVVTCSSGPPPITATYNLAFMYTDPDGVKHPLAYKYSPDGPGPPVCGQVYDLNEPDLIGPGGWVVNRASFNPVIISSDGTSYDFYAGSNRKDANGNQLTSEGPGATDTLGRVMLTQQTNAPNQILYKLYDSNGTLQTYTVNFTNITLSTAFNITGTCCGLVGEYSGTRKVISSIVLPNGRSYQFQYETNSYGALTQIVLPEGATINYAWATLQDSVRPDRSYRYVASRQVIVNGQSSTWTFSRTGNSVLGGGDQFTTTVTDPLGNQSVYTTSSGATTSAMIYAGSATGNPVRQYQVGYSVDGDPDSYARPQDQTQVAQRPIWINTTLDNGLVSRKEFDYDSRTYTNHPNVTGTSADYNTQTWTISRQNVIEVRQFDWGSNGSPGPLLLRIRRAYLHDSNSAYIAPNIVDKVIREIVCEPTATCDINNPTDEDSRTDYIYDGSAIASTSGTQAPQHDYTNFSSSYTTRGNPTAVKRWRSTSDSTPLTTSFVYDDLGNIRSIADSANNASSWSYLDRWANSACPPPTGGNSQAYVTQFTNALNQLVQFTNYPCSGLVQARQDQNDINGGRGGTMSTYDWHGRLTQKNLADGGQVSNSYHDSPPISVTTTTKMTSSTNLVSLSIRDGLGREIEAQQTSNPLCTVLVDTVYDALGRKSSVTNPYCSTSDSTYGTTSFAYDVLGRPTTVTPPDGATVVTSYTGRATSVSDEGNGTQPVQRISQTDGLGRLVSVCEVSSTSLSVGGGNVPVACGQDISATGFLTTYQYNLLGDLTQVSQNGLNSRMFAYDSVSRLTQASNPESGTIIYTYDSDSACPTPNAFPGLLVSRLDARSIRTCMQYDAGNRPTQRNYSDGTPTANFLYDVSSLTGLTATLTNPVGRLIQASTINTRTVNSYDPMGRVANQWQCTPQNCGSGWFPFAYVYDLMGNLISATNGVGTTFSYTYNNAAQLTTFTSNVSDSNHPGTLLSNVIYNALSQPTATSFGSGTTESQSYNKRGWLLTLSATNSSGGAATPGSGTITVAGSEKSTQTASAISGTGYVTFSGTLQSKQIQTHSATSGSGYVDLSGSERTTQTGTPGTGSVTVTGSERSTQINNCLFGDPCWQTVYDSGTVSITVNGFTKSVTYDGNSTSSTIASALASAFNGDTNSPVTASVSGATVNLTSKATGSSSNYSLSASSATNQSPSFSGTSFPVSTSGATLTGGGITTVYDSGTVTIIVNGFNQSVAYGQGSTSASLASALASAFNSSSSSPVTASANNSRVTVTAKATGASTNYSLSASSATNSSQFTGTSFLVTSSGSALTGGADATYATVYDSGGSTITVNGHSNTASWSGSSTTSASIASALASNINSDSAASVTASASGSAVSLTAKTAGSNTNYALSSSSTYDTTNFSSPSFSSTNSGSTLSGGADAQYVYDTGVVSVTVNSFITSYSYGQSDTTSSIASALASGLASSSVNASASVGTITLTAKATGAATNYPISASISYDTAHFSSASFTATSSGATLTGGTDNTLYSVSLSYAPNGDVLSANDSINGMWTYGYDPFNRLLNSNKNNGQSVYTYDYDRFGNRWHQNGPSSSQLGFDSNNHVIGVTGVGYDLAGDLASDGSGVGSHMFTYDAENRMSSASPYGGAVWCYTYDANGKRARKAMVTQGTCAAPTQSTFVDYLYDLAGHQIAEVGSTGAWNRAEIYAGGRHVATYSGGATGITYFNHTDWLGTERLRTDKSGIACETVTSLPFGDEQTTSGTCGDPSPMHFTGKQSDTESDLGDFDARYYSFNMGRFASPDWSAVPTHVPYADLSNPQTLNLYSYGRNNPITTEDPDGHQSLESQRKLAVEKAWRQEQQLVKRTGQGTNNWTAAEKAELLQTGRVSGYEGHHINSVKGHPGLAGDASNVKFVRGRAGNLAEHGGNFRNPTSGALLSRSVAVLQVLTILLDAAVNYKDAKTSGIEAGGFFGEKTFLLDPSKAANTLNGLTIAVREKDGSESFYNVRDGKYEKYGCETDCTVDPATLKGKEFSIINPHDIALLPTNVESLGGSERSSS